MKIWGGGEHCDVIVVGAAVSGQLVDVVVAVSGQLHVVVVVVLVVVLLLGLGCRLMALVLRGRSLRILRTPPITWASLPPSWWGNCFQYLLSLL